MRMTPRYASGKRISFKKSITDLWQIQSMFLVKIKFFKMQITENRCFEKFKFDIL